MPFRQNGGVPLGAIVMQNWDRRPPAERSSLSELGARPPSGR